MNLDVILKRFETPDEVRTFEKGRFDLVTIGGMTIGRAATSPAGNGPNMSAKRPAPHTAPSNTTA